MLGVIFLGVDTNIQCMRACIYMYEGCIQADFVKNYVISFFSAPFAVSFIVFFFSRWVTEGREPSSEPSEKENETYNYCKKPNYAFIKTLLNHTRTYTIVSRLLYTQETWIFEQRITRTLRQTRLEVSVNQYRKVLSTGDFK